MASVAACWAARWLTRTRPCLPARSFASSSLPPDLVPHASSDTQTGKKNNSPYKGFPILQTVEASPAPVPESTPAESLRAAIRQAGTFEDLLAVAGGCDPDHRIAALRRLRKLHAESSEEEKAELLGHPGFARLCSSVRRSAPAMAEVGEVVECLRILCSVGVTPASQVAQTLLHLVKARINELTPAQIPAVHSLLRSVRRSQAQGNKGQPLVEALLLALPIVFQAQSGWAAAKAQCASELCHLLSYSLSEQPGSEATLQLAHRMASWPQPWDGSGDVALSVLFSLGRLELASFIEERGLDRLHRRAYDELTRNIRRCQRVRLCRLLMVVGGAYRPSKSYWYDGALMAGVAERAVAERWTLAESATAAKTFTTCGYVDRPFLEYLAQVITTSVAARGAGGHFPVSQHLHPFSVFDIQPKPDYCDGVVDAVLDACQARQKHMGAKYWIRLLVDCIALDRYPQWLLDKVLSDFGANHGTKHGLDLCSLELVRRQCLARLGRYDGPDLVRECHLAVTTIFTCTRAVEQALIDGLGGDSTYVRSRLITRHGVFIDHAVVVRPGGFPVAAGVTRDGLQYVEDIALADNCKMVLFKVYHQNNYLANEHRLRGMYASELAGLRSGVHSLGHRVVDVDLQAWLALTPHDRITSLMKRLFEH